MVFKRKAMALALLAMCVECSTAFANSPLTQKLVEQAHFWEQRGRDDNAADAWRKVLKVDANNIEALVALGIFDAHSGNADLAKNHLDKLREIKAGSAQIRLVEKALSLGTAGGKSQLENARRLAQQGDTEAAADSYRMIGDASRLKGDAALEYYQVLAGTKSGYAEAKRGLEKLAKENPSNHKYALAYAQVLTYRDASRPEGIALLESLTSKADVSRQAEEAWRQALTWMGLQSSNSKYFRNYLEKHPQDKTIQDKLASVNRPVRNEVPEERRPVSKPKPESPLAKGSALGFKALDANDVPTAEKEFQSLIKSHPKDPVGYGGMGLVKMRQEEFIEARKFLQKALDFSSAKAKSNWKQAFDGANYWALIEDARTAFEDADSVKGIALLRKAVEINGTEPSGLLQLADALQAENDMAGAEENFKRVFNADKKEMRALDGLIGIYVLQKRLSDLEALGEYLLPRHLAIVANLKSEQMAAQAKQLEAAGDIVGAQRVLEDAVLIKPDDAWLRMSLAKIYLKRDMAPQAQALLDALTNVEKPDAEALYVSALLSQMQQLWWEGLQTLERIPANARKPEMFALQKQLWIRVQLDRIDLLNKRGYVDQVRGILAEIEAAAGTDSEYIGTLAALYIKLGDTERGFAMIRQAVQNTQQPSASLLLQYASTLMQANQEAELDAVMRKVAAMPKLQEDEVKSFKQLQKALSMRYSERAREAKDYAAAYAYIQPYLIETPDDNLLLLTLARIYSSAGDSEPAKELYTKVLETDPDNPEVLQGLVFAAIQIKDFSGAENYLEKLMRMQPENPRFIALAGNVARAQGHNSKALGYFKKALALEQAQRPLSGAGVDGLRLVTPGSVANNLNNFKVNPFAERKEDPVAAVTQVAAPAALVTAAATRTPPVLKEVPQLAPQYAAAAKPASTTSAVVTPVSATPLVANGSAPGATSTSGTTNTIVVPAAVSNSTGVAVAGNVSNKSVNAPALLSVPAVPPVSQSSAVIRSNPLPVAKPVAGNAVSGADVKKASPFSSVTGRKTDSAASTAPVSAEEAALIKEIDALNELNRSEVTAGFSARARSGQSGLSQLKDLETPIEAHITTLGYGQFGLKVIPVVIDAGTLQLNDANVAGQFGRNTILNEQAKFAKVAFSTQARTRGLSDASSIEQVAKGVALNLSYELAGVKLDVGSSPLNFPIQNVVGGLRWSTQSDGLNFSAEVSRRSVTDSYLSYAGAKDSLYGLNWGGVTRNGLRLDTSYDGEDGGVYGALGVYGINGKNVVKNTQVDAGAGIYWRAYRTKDTTVTTGLGLNSSFYKKNLRYFTYGHGGYFSPQSYIALNVPLEISGRYGKLSYQAGASVGVQHFREDATPYYPLISADQTELELFAAANPALNIASSYAGQSHTGLQYKISGALEYLLSPHFTLGGRFSADNSGDFTDASGMLYIRYTFEPRRGQVAFPPIAPKPYYLGN
ncbi:BCSC C-terminal domain-containing protein [Undibacterium sp. FT147W]|uniref:BCSC C-terminal domain-containing protein n=1 Tax=Undibacterium rivi TaxID=2828729 RepID=A0ABS5H254_9BURK|nr:cellulose biosynthesis protein BcsC [Undibacterium rivi]MBR7792788.1 BCSC C-terminal domain-containing protein [Undibacterium rivi]